MSSPHKALAAFAEDSDLVWLESLLKRFNLFEALGVVRHELRHSDFLAFLLDPSRNHGLGAAFLEEVLQSSSDLQFTDLGRATVLREWHNIDILVLDDVNHVAVLIENKIDTGEHSDQLSRYYDDVRRNYPAYQIVALYLTPNGDAPSIESYTPVSYSLVCKLIEKLVEDHRSTLGNDVKMLLEHYVQMLRRHILSESDVAELCRNLYQKHKRALDLIFEHRPPPTKIRDYLRSLVLQQPDLIPADKYWSVFQPREWDASAVFRGESTEHKWLLYFEFRSDPANLAILLRIAPGDQADCEKLHQMAWTNGFYNLWKKPILTAMDYEKPQEEIETLIADRWAAFLRDDLPYLNKVIRKEEWLGLAL